MDKKQFLLHLAKRAWLLLAFLVVLLAVISTAVRLSTPLLSRYRLQIQALASDIMQHPVTIKKVEASWYWFEPVIRFSDVEILNKQQSRPLLRVKKMALGIDIFASLFHRRLVPGLLLASGANITVHENQAKQWQIDGISDFQADEQEKLNSQDPHHVLAWLFAQPRIALEDINIHYLGRKGKVIPISHLRISLVNDGITHQLTGSAQLAQTIPTKLTFNGSFMGDLDDMDSWRGKFYIGANDILIPQWFDRFSYHHIKPTSGEMDVKVWTTWKRSQLQQIQSLVKVQNVNLHNKKNKADRLIQSLSANLAWQKQSNGWQVSGDHIALKMLGQRWPTNKFYFNYLPQSDGPADWQLFVNYFKPHVFSKLFDKSLLDNQQAVQLLEKLDPQVDIERFTLNYQQQQWSLTSGFNHLQWQAWQNIPGLTGLSGQVQWQGQQAKININSKHVTYTEPTLFPESFQFDKVTGNFTWQRQAQQWQLTGKAVHIANADVQLNAQLQMQQDSQQKLPTIDFNATYQAPDLIAAKKYLPLKVMKPHLNNWLLMAIQGGQASGKITLRGNLNDFPFNDGQGLFEIDSEIRNVLLAYHPGWPSADKVNAHVLFRGDSLQALVHSGILDGIAVKNINVAIPGLGSDKEMLKIEGNVQTDMRQGVHYIQHSPLIKPLAALKTMQLSGPMDLQLSLAIALYDEGKDQVDGRLTINKGKLHLPDWRLTLTQIKGLVNFTDQGIFAKQLQALLFNQATTLSLKTVAATAKQQKHTQIDLKGRLAIADLQHYFSLGKSLFYQGATDYQAQLMIPSDDNSRDKFTLHSTLRGIRIDAPQPFAKTAEQDKPLTVNAEFAKHKNTTINFDYHTLLNGVLQFEKGKKDYQLERAHLSMGDKSAQLPDKAGLTVNGKLDYMDVSEWQSFIKKYFSHKGTGKKKQTLAINDIDLTVAKLMAMHQQFNDLHIDLQQDNDTWLAQLDSPQIKGNVSLLPGSPNTIKATLDKLHITELAPSNKKTQLTMADIPNFDLAIKDLQWENVRLGEFDLNSETSPQQITINKLLARTTHLVIEAKGVWQEQDSQASSAFNGSINTRNLVAALKDLSITPVIDSNNGQLNFDIKWPGTPMDFSLAKVSGKANMNLRRGHISHLDKSTEEKIGLGKMLNILSLQTLPRRLTLDFSDLSQSGYSFDVFKGSFALQDGVAKTNDTYLDGPVAYASIRGSIDIANENYDLLLKVSPHLTSSLPVVATIAGGPIAGAITFVASKILSPEMLQVVSYSYKISGPWQKPTIKQIKLTRPKKTVPVSSATTAQPS